MALHNKGIEELAYNIVAKCCEDYREAYKNGDANELLKCKSFLLSGKVEIYTLNNFFGQEIIDTMDADLLKKYGKFEERHKAKQRVYKVKAENKKHQLEMVREEIKDVMADETIAVDDKKRLLTSLRARRYRLIGEINKLKREARD